VIRTGIVNDDYFDGLRAPASKVFLCSVNVVQGSSDVLLFIVGGDNDAECLAFRIRHRSTPVVLFSRPLNLNPASNGSAA